MTIGRLTRENVKHFNETMEGLQVLEEKVDGINMMLKILHSDDLKETGLMVLPNNNMASRAREALPKVYCTGDIATAILHMLKIQYLKGVRDTTEIIKTGFGVDINAQDDDDYDEKFDHDYDEAFDDDFDDDV